MATTYNPSTDAGRVRLLLSDVGAPWVFTDDEIAAFLALESGVVKRAAAQAIDTNATNEALASKVLNTQDVSTNGAAVATAMRAHAAALRAQADRELSESDDGAYFGVVPMGGWCSPTPERTQRPLSDWPFC